MIDTGCFSWVQKHK